jgi:hypothetical protein
MILTITSNKGKRDIDIQSWDDVTTETFQKLYAIDKDSDLSSLEASAVLLGLPLKYLFETSDKKLLEAIADLNFTKEQPFRDYPIPTSIKIFSKKGCEEHIAIPEKVGQLSVGQNILVWQKMIEVKTFEEMISWAIAIYLEPIYSEADFNYKNAVKLHDKILQLPITQTFSLGFFLLKPLMKGGLGTTSLWNLISIRSLVRRWLTGRRLARWQRQTAFDLTTI